MSKKLFFILISLLMISSFVLGACAPTPAPVEEVEEVEEMEEVEEEEERQKKRKWQKKLWAKRFP